MSQPPTAPQDPYQFDPYPPQGGGDPAEAPTQRGYAPQGDTTPYGAAPYGQGPQQGYAQPYAADPTQQPPYGQDPQQGYAQPYAVDPTQQPPYGGYPAYGAPGPSRTNVLAIVGFVLAILGFLGSWIPGVNFFCAVLGLAGLVLGVLGLVQVKKGKTGKGFSITAIILGALAIVVTVLVWVALVVWADNVTSEYEQALAELEQGTSELEQGGSEAEQDASAFEEEVDRLLSEETARILADDLDVEFGTFDGVEDDYGWVESALPVTLTNTSDEALSFDLDVAAVAADGTVIETDWVFVEALEPGASETVETFDFVDAENLEAMKTATFEVTRASDY